MFRITFLDAPAALFYLSGAAYGTAAGIVSAAIPQPSFRVPNVLKSVWGNQGRGGDAAAEVPALEPADSGQYEYSMLPVVVCGAPGCGKTTLLSWWSTGRRPAACKATVGADLFTTQLCVDHYIVSTQVWDTAGGTASLERLGPSFWRKAAAFLYVFNVGDAASFAALDQLRSLFQDQFDALDDVTSAPTPRPAVVLGACRHSDSSSRQVTVEQAEAWCRSRGAIYVEMRSSDEVAAVDLAIDLLVRACVCSKSRCGT